MTKDFSTEESAVVAAYATRHDAEIARSYLNDRGIDALVSADDVHTVVQFTQGARLVVLANDAEASLAALRDAKLLPEDVGAGPDLTGDADDGAGGRHLVVSTTAWIYIIVSALVAVLVVAGILYF